MNKETTTSTQDKPEKLSLRAAFTEKIVAALKEDKIPWLEGYYGTLLHELGHATGHESRLNREGVTKGGLTNSFGSPGYAKEELVAEMTSAFIAMETGIPFDDDNHKAYIQSWAEVLSKDENAIFKAAKEAGAAADYMLAKEKSIIEHEHGVLARLGTSGREALRAASEGIVLTDQQRDLLSGEGVYPSLIDAQGCLNMDGAHVRGRMNVEEEACQAETLACGEGPVALNESVPEVPKSAESKRQPWRISRNSSDEMSR